MAAGGVAVAGRTVPGASRSLFNLLMSLLGYQSSATTTALNNLPLAPAMDQHIYAQSREKRLIQHIADKHGVPYDLLSDEIHDYKESTGRGGADNLGKEKIEQIAKEIADRIGGGKKN